MNDAIVFKKLQWGFDSPMLIVTNLLQFFDSIIVFSSSLLSLSYPTLKYNISIVNHQPRGNYLEELSYFLNNITKCILLS